MRSASTFYSLLLLLSSSEGFRQPCEVFHRPLTVRGGSSFPDNSYQDENDPPDHETVQERVNAWRKYQQETYAHLSPEQAASVRDAQGRVKLLTHVGRGSRALIFFVLMWRDVHLYEVADQTYKGLFRLVTVIPLLLLFISNLAGAVVSITSPSHSAKKRLKAILNLDKLVEMLIIVFNFGRLTLFPSQYTPREIYIANTLHSVFFILQSQAFTRLTWDEFSESSLAQPGPPSSGMNMNPYSSYYGATEFATQDAYRNAQEPKHL